MLSNIGTAYLVIGCIFNVLTLGSGAAFYGFGPGAFWNIGFIASGFGLILAMFFAFLRTVTWPYGLYILVTSPDSFLPWLFYVWHQ